MTAILALIIVSSNRSGGQENVRQENGKSSIFLSYIFLSAGSVGRNDDQDREPENRIDKMAEWFKR
jgi:hypothetical protein